MVDVKQIEAFLAEVEEDRPDTPLARFVSRDKLAVPINEETGYSDLMEGYILEGYTSGIEGQFGDSTAVRLISPESGRRLTLWLTGFEQEHLKSHLSKWSDNGATFPMEIKFLRHKVSSRNGRLYNRFSATLNAYGDEVVVPPVPDDQYETVEN
jgi:hypothetical protein|tara:strand:+ start:19649 stop:20110 length:462 start_codon:yes stop_codon:yes gene_type:complete